MDTPLTPPLNGPVISGGFFFGFPYYYVFFNRGRIQNNKTKLSSSIFLLKQTYSTNRKVSPSLLVKI